MDENDCKMFLKGSRLVKATRLVASPAFPFLSREKDDDDGKKKEKIKKG